MNIILILRQVSCTAAAGPPAAKILKARGACSASRGQQQRWLRVSMAAEVSAAILALVTALVLLVVPTVSTAPHSVFNVRTFGAKGDGIADDGAAIASALAAAAAASAHGDAVTVSLPSGSGRHGTAVYNVQRPLVVNASNILLSIEAGATLRFVWDRDLNFSRLSGGWPRVESSGGAATMITVAPTAGSASPLTNVTLGGAGTVDGQGFMWWPFRYHVWEYINEKLWPPYFMTFTNIIGLEMSNLTLLNPPMITVQTCSCKGVRMHHLNLTAAWLTPQEFYDPVARSPKFAEWERTAPVTVGGVGQNGTCGGGGRVWADRPEQHLCEPPNTDGFDPGCGSSDVHLHDIFIENGDDSIVMKPGEGQQGCTRDVLVERVTILRGMGINIGGMGSGCVQNITFRDVLLDRPSLMGMEIKTENGAKNACLSHFVLKRMFLPRQARDKHRKS